MSAIRILLVEDNAGDAQLIRLYLEEADPKGFDLQVASRLSEALDQLSNNEYDIVLLDLSLPDSDGIETLNSILDRGLGIPVVVQTGYDDALVGSAAVQAGALDYLVKKDVNPGTLSRVICYSIERYRAGRALAEARLGFEGFCGQVHQGAQTILNCTDKLLEFDPDNQHLADLVEQIRTASSHLINTAGAAAA